jgi:acetylornithine deacetylase
VTKKIDLVNKWLEDNQNGLYNLLQELINRPSVNPFFKDDPELSGEQKCQEFISDYLEAIGLDVEMWEPDSIALSKYKDKPGYYAGRNFDGRPNLAATLKGQGEGRSIILAGHVDVVPAGTGWTADPFNSIRKNGFIYGRGASDMKAGLAAMMFALKALKECDVLLKGDVTFGSIVDEEAGGMGTLDFVTHGFRADACFMGEPTELEIHTLCRGILWGKIIVKGRSGHIERPEKDWRDGGPVDAIALARMVMDQIDILNMDWAVNKNHPLIPFPCQIKIAQINGGEFPTAYANRVEIVFDAQYLPEDKDENWLGGNVKKELEEFFQAISNTNPWLKENPLEVEWLVDADCGETNVDDPFVKLVEQAVKKVGLPAVVSGSSGHMDIGWFINVGIPTINFGVRGYGTVHQNDERCKEEDLLRIAKVVSRTLIDWCGTDD